MSRRILIMFATNGEAAAALTTLSAQPTDDQKLFEWTGGHVVLSGMGPLAACQAVTKYGPGHDELWNLGMCGSFSDRHKPGTIAKVSNVEMLPVTPYQLDSHAEALHKMLHPSLTLLADTKARLATCPFPLRAASVLPAYRERFDLVDMEGYSIAWAAQQIHLPCHLWKVVSDRVEDTNPTCIQNKLSSCSHLLSKYILSLSTV